MLRVEQHRARVPRSRKGCVTCRSKHMKCDETKPVCNVCTGRGQKCGGYRMDIRWSRKHEKTNQQIITNALPLTQSTEPLTDSPLSRKSPTFSKPEACSMPTVPPSSINLGPPFSHPFEADPSLIMAHKDILSLKSLVLNSRLLSSHRGVQTDDSVGHELGSDTCQFGLGVETSDLVEGCSYSFDGNPYSSSTIGLSPQMPDEYALPSPNVTYMPSVFVEYWFRDICPLWSQYDSDANLNRTIAAALWSTSEAVYLSLQGMAAAYMSSKVPVMRQTSISSMKAATKLINADLQTVKTHQIFDSVPTGLIYALLCIGTSICWLNATQLGLPYLREVKTLLCCINRQKDAFSEDQRQLLDFFNKSWLYCEMLLSMVTSNCTSLQKIDSMGEIDAEADAGASLPLVPVDRSPHPWTGFSSTGSLLFMRTMKLCHEYRRVIRTQATFASSHFTTAMQLIDQAAIVEGQIFNLSIGPPSSMEQTDDQKTPNKHLLRVAEAYRQAALLQLYQTFPELVARRYGLNDAITTDVPSLWNTWIVPIALKLVTLLQELPADSGSKMTQPLLCVTASTGLRRRRACMPLDCDLHQHAPSMKPSHKEIEDFDMLHYVDFADNGSEGWDESDFHTQSDLEIMTARQFIRERLSILKSVLPPKPLYVAQTLTETIWRTYDAEQSMVYTTHWIDIMNDQNLKSNFA